MSANGRSLVERFKDAVRSFRVEGTNLQDPALARLFDGGPVAAGVPVNESNALTYAAVWSAVSAISSTIGSLPLKLYQRLPGGGKTPYVDHSLYPVVHAEPNVEMTAVVLLETLVSHVLLYGNGYAEIERDGAGRPAAIWPLPPDRVSAERDGSGRLIYLVRGVDGRDVLIPSGDMLHIPGLSFDGIRGYSVIHKARESLGLGLAAERFGSTFFGNGSTFGGFLTHPQRLSPEARQNITESLAKHQGPTRAHRILLLQEGMSFVERRGVVPEDAQFLGTRVHQVQDVCRWFRISPYKLQELSRATFSNIEALQIEFYTDTIRPWLVKFEQEFNRKLISRLERRRQVIEFSIEGALRGDSASRAQLYDRLVRLGAMTPNELRAMENMNPVEGGNEPLVDRNLVSLRSALAWSAEDDAAGSRGAVDRGGLREVHRRDAAALERALVGGTGHGEDRGRVWREPGGHDDE